MFSKYKIRSKISYLIFLIDINKIHRITNHPVHIYDDAGSLSPSAFIPFCQFGKRMFSMGIQTELFKIPVCNSFSPKIFYNQLCYEVDVNNFIDKDYFSSNELNLGLSFLVDTNFNRQYSLNDQKSRASPTETIGKLLTSIESYDNDMILISKYK